MPHKFTLKAAEHPIESVTVFRSHNAQIVRTISLELKAGNNQITITGLSSFIDTESFRVSGLGDARLLDVVCNVYKKGTIEEESAEIRDARKQIRDLRAETNILNQELEMLQQYGKAMGGTSIMPEQAIYFTEHVAKKRVSAQSALNQLAEKIESLETFVEEKVVPKKGRATGKAVITVHANEDGLVQLTVSYLVSNTRWEPTYDLHASSEADQVSASVSLHYRVQISQSTGEHWNEAGIILSTTATDALNAGIPEPKSLSILVQRTAIAPAYSPVYRTKSAAPPRRMRSFREAFMDEEEDDDEDEEEEQESIESVSEEDFIAVGPANPIAEGLALVSKSPISVSYTVDGKSTILSDGEVHKVSVAQLPFEATITHVTVPRQETLAYIQCEVKNTTDYHLLSGPVNVFMNDRFVSKTSISDINTGDMFRCSLGIDTSARVLYSLTSTSVTSKATAFVEQYKTTTYTSTTTISNRHTGEHPISVVEKSSIPVAPEEDKAIRVFLKQPLGLAESDDGVEVDLGREDGFKVKWGSGDEKTKDGQKQGKFVWSGKLPSGSEVVLVSQWEIRAPVELAWAESF